MQLDNLNEAKKVGPNDTFQYHCFRCGECCHNVKESIMLTTWELFKLAKHLGLPMDEVVNRYLTPVFIGGVAFPLLMMETKPYGDACIFYKQGCSIQEAKPIACKLYPLNIEPGKHNGLSYFIVSQKPHHYTGEIHRVGNWMEQNLSPDDRRFMIRWFKEMPEIGRLMWKIPQAHNGAQPRKDILFPVLVRMYFAYDTRKDFWKQFDQNMAALKMELTRVISSL